MNCHRRWPPICRSALALSALATLLVGIMGVGRLVWGDSALPLLANFDAQRIELAYPPADEESTGELAKLVYRLRSVDPQALRERSSEVAVELGDLIRVEGRIRDVRRLPVPDHLVEYLEFPSLQVVDLAVDGDPEKSAGRRLVTADLPGDAAAGDTVRGIAMLIELDPKGHSAEEEDSRAVFAVSELGWLPQSPPRQGWKMLSDAGVDVGSLGELSLRTGLPLANEDGEAFYSILAAADSLSSGGELPAPRSVTAIDLLATAGLHAGSAGAVDSKQVRSGDWIEIPLETVQITRISVTEPHRKAMLGADHYFQIDAVANLGRVDVRIENPADPGGPAASFENRYPVSVVAADLPAFLAESMRQRTGGPTTVADVSEPILVKAFFFRLWSYSSDYMDQFGGGDQIGPLLIAARIIPRELPPDPAGVAAIAWLAAASVLIAIAAIAITHRVSSRRDRAVRQKRSDSESQRFTIPEELSD